MTYLYKVVHFLLLLLFIFSFAQPVEAYERAKASVIVAFINNAQTTYDEEVSARVWNTLNKKVNGIYNVLPEQPFLERVNKLGSPDVMQAERDILVEAAQQDNVDYLVLCQLEPFIRKEKYTVFTYGKDMTATMLMKLIDVPNKKYIYNGKFIHKASDSTTDWLIGNKSVALMAIDTVMIQVGETISFRLPLEPSRIQHLVR